MTSLDINKDTARYFGSGSGREYYVLFDEIHPFQEQIKEFEVGLESYVGVATFKLTGVAGVFWVRLGATDEWTHDDIEFSLSGSSVSLFFKFAALTTSYQHEEAALTINMNGQEETHPLHLQGAAVAIQGGHSWLKLDSLIPRQR